MQTDTLAIIFQFIGIELSRKAVLPAFGELHTTKGNLTPALFLFSMLFLSKI